MTRSWNNLVIYAATNPEGFARNTGQVAGYTSIALAAKRVSIGKLPVIGKTAPTQEGAVLLATKTRNAVDFWFLCLSKRQNIGRSSARTPRNAVFSIFAPVSR